MNHSISFGLFALLTLTAMSNAYAQMKVAGPSLHPLKPNDVVADGAYFSWHLSDTSTRADFKVAELDMDSERLVVRVGGALEHLTRKSLTWKPQREMGPKVGDTCLEVWENTRVRIEIFYTLTDSGEEGSVFSGRMKVSADGKTETFGVQGFTGC